MELTVYFFFDISEEKLEYTRRQRFLSHKPKSPSAECVVTAIQNAGFRQHRQTAVVLLTMTPPSPRHCRRSRALCHTHRSPNSLSMSLGRRRAVQSDCGPGTFPPGTEVQWTVSGDASRTKTTGRRYSQPRHYKRSRDLKTEDQEQTTLVISYEEFNFTVLDPPALLPDGNPAPTCTPHTEFGQASASRCGLTCCRPPSLSTVSNGGNIPASDWPPDTSPGVAVRALRCRRPDDRPVDRGLAAWMAVEATPAVLMASIWIGRIDTVDTGDHAPQTPAAPPVAVKVDWHQVEHVVHNSSARTPAHQPVRSGRHRRRSAHHGETREAVDAPSQLCSATSALSALLRYHPRRGGPVALSRRKKPWPCA